MVNLGLISRHYELREKILDLIREDQERKNVIKLSILRLAILKQGEIARTKKLAKGSPTKVAVKSLAKDYEIELNKLKQEYSTKLKLHDAKLQSLKQENERLKAQVKRLNYDSSSSSSSIFQTRKRVLPSHRSIFSPEKFGSTTNKTSIIRHTFPTIFDDELITPIKKIPETKLVSELMKSASSMSPTKDARSQDSRLLADDFAIPNATSSPTGSSKFRSPTKFMENFDNEGKNYDQLTRRRSLSPEFTPNRRRRVLRSTDSSVPYEEKSENSQLERNGSNSVEHSGSPIKGERRIKKVKKRKILDVPSMELSGKLKTVFPEVDDGNLNTLARYEDAHFEENKEVLETSSRSLKRELDLDEQILDPEPPKKRRNVFTID